MNQLNRFTTDFVYEKGSIFSGWSGNSPGDCQDFALGISRILFPEKWNWFWCLTTRKFSFYRAKSPINKTVPRHLVLYVKDLGYVDSTVRTWRSSPEPHHLKWRIPIIWVLAQIFINSFKRT